MTDTDRFLSFLQYNNGTVTLGDILQTHFSAEYRKHISMLRKKGYQIEVELNRKEPSKNRYVLTAQIYEKDGQMCWIK